MSLFIIERNQGTAVYAQIARILETEFVKNGMPGDRLPSEGTWMREITIEKVRIQRI